jgi:hypothetical protein
MAALLLQYDAKNTLAQKTIDYILSLGVFSAVNMAAPSLTAFEESLEDVRYNRIFDAQNAHDLLKKCLE